MPSAEPVDPDAKPSTNMAAHTCYSSTRLDKVPNGDETSYCGTSKLTGSVNITGPQQKQKAAPGDQQNHQGPHSLPMRHHVA